MDICAIHRSGVRAWLPPPRGILLSNYIVAPNLLGPFCMNLHSDGIVYCRHLGLATTSPRESGNERSKLWAHGMPHLYRGGEKNRGLGPLLPYMDMAVGTWYVSPRSRNPGTTLKQGPGIQVTMPSLCKFMQNGPRRFGATM